METLAKRRRLADTFPWLEDGGASRGAAPAGQLGAEQRAVLEQHLAGCPMCRVHLETYLKAIELGRRALADDDPDAPADLPEELVEAVLAARAAGRHEPE